MNLPDWLFRLQQRAAITRTEGVAILAVVLSLAAGYGIGRAEDRSPPFAADFYALADDCFVQIAADSSRVFAEIPERSAAYANTGPRRAAAPRRAPARRRARAPSGPPAPMDLNTATSAQLQRIPRIGPAIAERIIDYREAFGPFRRLQDITNVRGIGPATFETISPFLFIAEEEPSVPPDSIRDEQKIRPIPSRLPEDLRQNPLP